MSTSTEVVADTPAKSFTLTVDGTKHTMLLPLAIMHTIRLRSEVGWSQPQLLEFLKSPDLDTFAVCVWMARLQAGETVSFESVADSIHYSTKLEVGIPEDDHPES